MTDEKYPWELWREQTEKQRAIQKRQFPVRHTGHLVDHRLRYGAGMVVGFVTVRFIKRELRSIPVLGALLSPILALVPTVIAGPALGAAAVYGYEQGDPLAAVPLVKEKMQQLRKHAIDTKSHVETNMRRTLEETSAAAQGNLSAYARELETQFKRAVNEVDLTSIAQDLDKSVRDTNFEKLIPADIAGLLEGPGTRPHQR